MPVQYEGVVAEHRAVRERAGLFDVSHMGELRFTGNEAVSMVDRLVTGRIDSLKPGQARYTLAVDERGMILDDLIVYRVGDDDVLVVCNAGNREKIATRFFAESKAADCDTRDESDRTALIALQGPRAVEIASAAGASAEVTGLRPFRLARGQLRGASVLWARTGYTGEDGFELFCDAEAAPTVWRELLRVGEKMGLSPAGLGARDTLRLEAALCLYGQDIDESTHPFEAKLDWVVKLDKGPFVGRDALRALKAEAPKRRLVGFEMVGRGIARHGHRILDPQGQPIGLVTSGSPAPSLGKNIGLAYVPISHAEVGTPLCVEVRTRVVDAVVCPTPFYRRPR